LAGAVEDKETVVRTFRLPLKRDHILMAEAEEKGITVNSLLNSILVDHQGWLKVARDSGFVYIHRSLYRAFIEELDEETLKRLGRTVVLSWLEDMAQYLHQSTDPEKILDTIEFRYSHDSLMKANFTRNKGDYTLVFTHDMGPKFSVIAEAVARELVARYFHAEPRITRGESVVTAKFRASHYPTT